MRVLVVNSGSSSLKYQFIDLENEQVIAKGNCERIGLPEGIFTHQPAGQDKQKQIIDMPHHSVAIQLVVEAIAAGGDLKIDAIGHRVVQGGDYFVDSVVVTEEVLEKIREFVPMAPLHNPPALAVIEACRELFDDIPNVAVFDTSFHTSLSRAAASYALPKKLTEQYAIKRYGAHGTSHRFVAQAVKDYLGTDEDLRILSAHIGNGASLCAIHHGKSQDTTMGFTPLEGLMMGTRCGSIDPAIVPYVMMNSEYTAADMDHIMNKESGLLGLSGLSSDLREIEERAVEGDEDCQHALDVYCHIIRRNMGSMVYSMGGCDVLAFTAGCGENSDYVRKHCLEGLEDLGYKLDEEKNAVRSGEIREISAPDSKVKILVCPTNEELMIALDVQRLTQG